MKKILFVCLGNICRSPLAEAIFVHKLKEKDLSHLFKADSCGTANYHVGDKPDPRTLQNALTNGVSINHLGRQLHNNDLEEFDLVLAMDESNLQNIHRLPNASNHHHKIKLMRSYDADQKKNSVPDPYYGTEKDFQRVFEILNHSIDRLLVELTSDNQ